MMKILLMAATEFEISNLRNDRDVDALIAGIGVPASIYGLLNQLHSHQYDMVIQAGIGGSFDENFQPGECFFIREDCFADLGIQEKGSLNTVFDLGFANADTFPFTEGWLINQNLENYG